MRKRKSVANLRIEREIEDLQRLLKLLPQNPIPWLPVVKIIAPVLVRLAIRITLKKMSRSLGEAKVNAIVDTVSGLIDTMLEPGGGP